MSEALMEFTRPVVGCGIIVFNIFGNFGNLNILWACKRGHLRGKHGILLTTTSFFQNICLIFELCQTYCMFFTAQFTRELCFWLMSPYVFTICMQQFLLLTLSIDLLISIFLPAFHRRTPTSTYCCVICLPAVAFSAWLWVLGVTTIDDETLWLCNPPLAYSVESRKIWTRSCVLISALTLFFYFILLMSFLIQAIKKYRAKKKAPAASTTVDSYEEKAIRSVSILVIAFLFSWFIALLGSDTVQYLGLSPDIVPVFQTYMVFPAMLSYSEPYYLLFINSKQYRTVFKDQLRILFGMEKSPTRETTRVSVILVKN